MERNVAYYDLETDSVVGDISPEDKEQMENSIEQFFADAAFADERLTPAKDAVNSIIDSSRIESIRRKTRALCHAFSVDVLPVELGNHDNIHHYKTKGLWREIFGDIIRKIQSLEEPEEDNG
jgi:hypothetical protein